MPTVTLAVDDGLARLTLNRPDAANTINDEFARDLRTAVVELSMDPSVRAVLLTGSGRFFCGGGDLRAFRAAGDTCKSMKPRRVDLPVQLPLSRGWVRIIRRINADTDRWSPLAASWSARWSAVAMRIAVIVISIWSTLLVTVCLHQQ